jgi:hypothetical protein
MRVDLQAEYAGYLIRFDQLVGKVPAGKWKGRLVSRFTFEEFSSRFTEFRKFEKLYRETMERGDTVNDTVIKLLRDRSAELLLEGGV